MSSTRLLILGVHISSDAYPNVRYKVQALKAEPDVREINSPAPMHLLFKKAPTRIERIFALGWFAVLFGFAHLRVLIAYLRSTPPAELYVPYPSVFVLWLLSWLPRSRRPGRIVADVFISLHDTVTVDRQLIAKDGIVARLLHACERRAYHSVDMVVADTRLNAERLMADFSLRPDKVTALPLSIDELTYSPSSYAPRPGICTVLFTGTFVPLQGVTTIAEAIILLRDRPDIQFRLIGFGQSAAQVQTILRTSDANNWQWQQDWQTAGHLAAEIRAADICLGIFGQGDKTQRVWPLKNYAYMAVGRAIITANTHCAQELLAQANEPVFASVPPADPVALATAISELADDPTARVGLARASRDYYHKHLRTEVSIDRLRAALAG